MKRVSLAVGLLLSLGACEQPSALQVTDAWARDSVGRTSSAAVFMTIASPSADRLVSASASIANETDLMTMKTANAAMAMDYVDAIDVPAGVPVSLDPSGLHVWLADLKRPLVAGESFPLVFKFEKGGERRVLVSVISPAAAPPGS